jgi:uncharacterized protein YdhG (YjbR/CyaY superfamily)
MAERFDSVDDYIESFPPDTQAILEEVRRAIRTAAPGTEETISYQIPTVTLDGKYLVYFAGWKHHVSLYPIHTLDEPLESEVATDPGRTRFASPPTSRSRMSSWAGSSA